MWKRSGLAASAGDYIRRVNQENGAKLRGVLASGKAESVVNNDELPYHRTFPGSEIVFAGSLGQRGRLRDGCPCLGIAGVA